MGAKGQPGGYNPNPYRGPRVQAKARVAHDDRELFNQQAARFGFPSTGDYLAYLVRHVQDGTLNLAVLGDLPGDGRLELDLSA